MKRLHSLSYKTLFAILFFSLAGIVFFIKIGGKTEKVSAAWWDDMWHYRKAISIDNSSGSDLTDFQVALSIGTSQLIADGKMQNNCNDIRITDINGNLLPYWIETTGTNKCNQTADTRIWIKANSLPTSGSTVYIYYGNPSADNQSSGQNTFIYFKDNFQTSDVDWNWSNGGVENGWAKTWANGNDSPGSTMVWLKNIIDITNQEVVVEFTVKSTKSGTLGHTTTNVLFNPIRNTTLYNNTSSSTIANGNGNSIITFGDYTNWYGKVGFDSSTGQASNIANSTSYPLYQFNTDGWVRHVHKLTSSGLLLSGYSLGGLDTNSNPWVYTEKTITSGYTKPNSIILAIGEQYNETTWMSEVFVRKYASTQPTTSNQSEEIGGGPIAYWKFDEGSGTTAYNSAENILNASVGSTNWVSEEGCVSGKCIQASGTVSYNPKMNITSNVTYNIWAKITAQNPDTWPIVLGRNSHLSYGFRLNKAANNFYFEYGNGSCNSTTWGTLNLNSNAVDSQWHMYTMTQDGTTIKVYLDAKLVGSASVSSFCSDTSSPLYLSTNTLPGYIDEAKIYPYARTADQVKQDYNSRGTLSGAGVNLGVKSNTGPSLKSSLVGYWKLDENNGNTVYDSSGNGHNGTLLNSPTWSQGKVNNALEFLNSGSQPVQPVQISGTGTLENVTDSSYTFSAWIKPSNNNSIQYAVTRPGYHTGIYYNTNQTIGFILWNSTPTNYNATSTQTYPPNNWYHVVATIDDTNKIIKLYINGKLDGSRTYSGSLRDYGTGNYLIGSAYYSGTCSDNVRYCFNGLIDEVKIYNKALTADEIKQDYNANSAIQFGSTNQTIGGTTTSLDYCIPGDTSYCVPPVAEYNFEENTGTTAKDTSGNGNDGTFGTGSSAPTWTVGANNKGTGIKFNGSNNYISIPTYTYTANATIDAWVKADYSNGNQIIIGSPGSISLGLYNIGSTKALIGSSIAGKAVGIANNFINNSWNHLAVVFDNSGNATYYCNGQLLSNSGTNSWTWSSGAYIGRRDSGTYFNGSLDRVKIYNYARTPAQIAYDYNKGAPVGWWKLDECQGSVTNDSSGNGNTGTINIGSSGTQTSLGTCAVGTSAAWTNGSSGKVNSSLNFDGTDDYISLTNNTLNFTKAITISAWIKRKGNADATEEGIVSDWGPFLLRSTKDTRTTSFWVSDGSSYVKVETTIDNDTWFHILGTWDGANNLLILYKNGKKVSQNTTSFSSLRASSGVIRIGSKTSGDQRFNGQIDDVRIYNYALTAEQVKQVYNGGSVSFN